MESKVNLLIFYRIYLVKCLSAQLIYVWITFSVVLRISPGSHWNSRNTCPRLTNLPHFSLLFASQLHCLDRPLCQSASGRQKGFYTCIWGLTSRWFSTLLQMHQLWFLSLCCNNGWNAVSGEHNWKWANLGCVPGCKREGDIADHDLRAAEDVSGSLPV